MKLGVEEMNQSTFGLEVLNTFRPTMRAVIVIFALIGAITANKLPSYMKACKASDFEACAIASGQAAIPSMIKGDPSIKLPVMDPLKIKRINIVDDGQQKFRLNVNFTDLVATGLKDAKFTNISFTDVGPVKRLVVAFRMDKIMFKSDYSVNGQVLVLPITGTGPCELDFDDVAFTLVLDLKPKKIKGVTHLSLLNISHSHTLKKIRINLKNLFNGNKLLGDNMNQVLNENWEGLNDQMGGIVVGAIIDELKPFFRAVFEDVPYNQIFL